MESQAASIRLCMLISVFLVEISRCTSSLNGAFPCPDSERVCSSAVRVGHHNGVGGSVIDEGPYCTCDTCPTAWEEDGDQTLTWYHHERADWLVQYKFCEPIIPKVTCADKGVVAAIVEADSNGWNPWLKSMACRCPGGHYYMRGWMLEGDTHWDYHYTCERPVCSETEPCVKHYLDNSLKRTAGYEFHCSCAEGQICPTDKASGKENKPDGKDSTGFYVNGFCLKIHSNLRKLPQSKVNSVHQNER